VKRLTFGVPSPRGWLGSGEKLRLAGLVLALSALLAVFTLRRANIDGARSPHPSETEARLPASIATPHVRADEYRRTALDATREQRVSIESRALELAFADSRTLSDEHFEPLGGVELDAQRCAELIAASDASRGRLLRARGRIEAVHHFDAADGSSEHWRGRLKLEDGARAFFAVLGAPTSVAVGDFVRFDGFFLQIACESEPGGWLDAPLLVGPSARRSYPALGRVTRLDADDFANVHDGAELGGAAELALWKLVAYARDVDAGSIDWDDAPVLDAELLARITADGAAFRGRPMRIDAASVRAIALQSEGENPARVERMAHGWLGSWAWIEPTPRVVEFVAPKPDFDVRAGDELSARGFFFANRDFESAQHGSQRAPFFVVQSFERGSALAAGERGSKSPVLALALLGMLGLGCFVVRRDERQSAELRLALTRRRRTREQLDRGRRSPALRGSRRRRRARRRGALARRSFRVRRARRSARERAARHSPARVRARPAARIAGG
jgi:hypothetical protein